MKKGNLKYTLYTFSIISGIIGALSFSPGYHCHGVIYARDPHIPYPEYYLEQGTVLMDQDYNHYIPLPKNYLCMDNEIVCTVYFDEISRKFKQCDMGEMIEVTDTTTFPPVHTSK